MIRVDTGEYDTETDVELNYDAKQSLPLIDSEHITINIETCDGVVKQFEVFNTFTISMLKQLIGRKFQIPAAKQEIKYKQKVCKGIHQIVQCGISDGDTIQLFELNDDNNQIKISLKDQEQTQYHINCSYLITLKEFKQQVYSKIPIIPINEQVLCFQGTELINGNMTLQQYGIYQDCVIEFGCTKTDVKLP